MDHDRLFKELLTTFFMEFVDLFLPDVAAYIDRDSIEFLDKEVFTDVTSGERHEVDIVVKARFRGEEAFFLIHVEDQASPEADFGRRMFRYFARLYEKYGLPVYPVVIFSYDAPKRPEPDHFEVAFPDRRVLHFQYVVIQLNRLPWRQYVNQQNPVASALMAKMKIAPKDRPKVKVECLRLLATLKLTPAKAHLISGFIDSYLKLNPDEQQVYERELAAVLPPQRETIMELMTSWKREGIQEGKEGMLTRMLERRFGTVPADIRDHMHRLAPEQMDELSAALFDITDMEQLMRWFTRRPTS